MIHFMSEEFDHEQIYYKVTNRSECHDGYQYHDGLNHLNEPFAKNGSGVLGGLYFTDIAHISHFFYNSVYVRKIRIPYGSQVVKDGSDKWRTDQLWFGQRWGIEEFIRHHANYWDVSDWCRIWRCTDLSEAFFREFD